MSATILPFRKLEEPVSDEQKINQSNHAEITKKYSRSVDYHLNINATAGIGYEYISNILGSVFDNIGTPTKARINQDTYSRVDYQINDCSVFDCINLIEKIDTYLDSEHVQKSSEKAFFIHIRNRAFLLKESFRKTKQAHLSDLQA